MYLLPKEHPATKKILEGTSSRCDIYTEVTNDIKSEQQIDEFLKFVETYLNKIKRLQCRKARVRSRLTALFLLLSLPYFILLFPYVTTTFLFFSFLFAWYYFFY